MAVRAGRAVALLPWNTRVRDIRIREIVCRAVLAGNDDSVATGSLLAEAGTSRYRAQLPAEPTVDPWAQSLL